MLMVKNDDRPGVIGMVGTLARRRRREHRRHGRRRGSGWRHRRHADRHRPAEVDTPCAGRLRGAAGIISVDVLTCVIRWRQRRMAIAGGDRLAACSVGEVGTRSTRTSTARDELITSPKPSAVAPSATVASMSPPCTPTPGTSTGMSPTIDRTVPSSSRIRRPDHQAAFADLAPFGGHPTGHVGRTAAHPRRRATGSRRRRSCEVRHSTNTPTLGVAQDTARSNRCRGTG